MVLRLFVKLCSIDPFAFLLPTPHWLVTAAADNRFLYQKKKSDEDGDGRTVLTFKMLCHMNMLKADFTHQQWNSVSHRVNLTTNVNV